MKTQIGKAKLSSMVLIGLMLVSPLTHAITAQTGDGDLCRGFDCVVSSTTLPLSFTVESAGVNADNQAVAEQVKNEVAGNGGMMIESIAATFGKPVFTVKEQAQQLIQNGQEPTIRNLANAVGVQLN